MFIRTRRLFLRPAWPEDAGALRTFLRDEAAAGDMGPAPGPDGLADAEAFAHGRATAYRDTSLLIWKRTSGDPVLVGSIGFAARRGAEIELSCRIGESHSGQGYATEAGQAMLELAFEGLRLPRLTAVSFSDNPASSVLLRKLGFQPTGMTGACRWAGYGRHADATLHRLDREEWHGQAAVAIAA